MSDPLYRREVIRLAADAHGAGHLPAPAATGEAFNPSCGDRVRAELAIVDGCIVALAHETRACVLTQASASILGDRLIQHAKHDVETLRDQITAMLKGGAPPATPFEDFAVLAGAAEHTARHRCVLLPIEAVLNALESLESGEPAGEGSK